MLGKKALITLIIKNKLFYPGGAKKRQSIFLLSFSFFYVIFMYRAKIFLHFPQ